MFRQEGSSKSGKKVFHGYAGGLNDILGRSHRHGRKCEKKGFRNIQKGSTRSWRAGGRIRMLSEKTGISFHVKTRWLTHGARETKSLSSNSKK